GGLLATIVAAIIVFWPKSPPGDNNEPKGKPPVGEARYALSFGKNGCYVAIPNLSYDGGPITVEAWIQPHSKETAVVAVGGGRGSVSLFCGGVHGLGFSAGEAGKGYSADWGEWPAPPSGMMHVAGVWDGKEISCFIDGKLARKNVRQEYGK